MNEWKTNKLSSLGVIQTGSTPKTSVKDNFGDFIPFIKPADFQPDGVIKYENDGLSEKGLSESRLIKQNSVVMVCIGATIGKVGYTTIDVTSNQQINSFTPFDGLLTKYCYYAMLDDSFKRKVIFSSGQATLPIINKTKWSNLELTYPDDIEEQKCIVAILDQAFSDIEQARAKTEQNLLNARELFESYLQKVFSQRGEGWEIKRVAEIADTCLGKMLDKRKNKGDLKPYLRNLNVQWFNINISDLLEMRFENSEHNRYSVKKGDLLICEGGYPGRAAIWSQDGEIYFQKALHRVRFHNTVYNRWLLYYLYISDGNGTLKASFTGAGIQHFTGKALKNLSLPIPKENKAKDFVEKFDAIFEEVMNLEKVYQKKILSIDELKKSILKKAFTGQLTQSDKPPPSKGAAA